MAGVWLIPFLFLYSSTYFVKADECVAYDFESNYDSLFGNEVALCTGMSKWISGNYSELAVESFKSNSGSFIAPSSTLSCASSFEFMISAGGEVEVNVYTDTDSMSSHLTLLVMQSVPGGNDAVLCTISISSTNIGWQTLRSTVIGIGTQPGYIVIMGIASEEANILVDSFRYIPPNVDEKTCVIYDEENEDSTTENPNTTTQSDKETEDCVTYNFEKDFEISFTTDNYLCDGFLPWHLDNYTSVNIDSPNPDSTVFMAPNEISSCISSFIFNMAPDGIIEANVYMEPVTALDHIIVLAQKVTDKEYDTVAGFQMYHPENQVFTAGWNILRFSLLDLRSFDGYLIFIGSADKDSTVLVDSVRYIPPLTPPDDATCNLY